MNEVDALAEAGGQPPVAAPEQSGPWSLLDPAVVVAATIPALAASSAGSRSIEALRAEPRRRCADVARRDPTGLEEMLTAQAVVLHGLFTEALAGAQQHLLAEPEAQQQRPDAQWQFPKIDLGDPPPTEESEGSDHGLCSILSLPAPALRDDPQVAAVGARYRATVARR
jgi:hypothetical protein